MLGFFCRLKNNPYICTMIKFKDLKFVPRSIGGGVGAIHTFDNGITISVQASELNYSTPREDLSSPNEYSSFEVAMWDEEGEWVTKQLFPDHNDDVIGWLSRKEINRIINKLNV